MTKEVKAAWIGGICGIIATSISTLPAIINVNIKNDKLLNMYENIQLENLDLKAENSDLQNQILSLIEKNKSLESKLLLIENGEDKKEPVITDPASEFNKRVSIFDLETFKGEGGWHKSTYDIDYTDTYDNEFVTSYWGKHYAISENIKSSLPIYLLDNKYSVCEGQMAWSKGSKNIEGSAWLEFYSGDECIYTTEPISADSKILDFSFSVEGVEKLTIVRNATKDMNDWDTIHIVYPYLNLVE